MIPNITLNHPPGPVRKLKNPPSRCSLTLFPHFGRTQFRRRRGTQSYVITSLNTHTVDFEELKFASSNITSLRMMDPKSFELRNAVSDWEEGEKRYNRFFRISPEYVKVSGAICVHCSRVYGNFLPPPPQTESIVVHDAVKIFATALREMHSEDEVITQHMSCQQPSEWRHGLRIVEYMKMVSVESNWWQPAVSKRSG